MGFCEGKSHLEMDDDWGVTPMKMEHPHMIETRVLYMFFSMIVEG